jgi:hypothetical protein
MKIKIGDKVKFLNDVGGGLVKKIIDKDTIEVLTDDDFELPVLMTEVIVVENAKPEAKIETPIKEEINYEVEFDKRTDEVAVFFGFLHKDQKKKDTSDIDFYLINDSNFYFDYNILVPSLNRWESIHKGILDPNAKAKLLTIKKDEVQNFEKFHVQGYFFRHFRQELKPIVNDTISINSRKFYQTGSFQENDFFNEDTIIYSVIEENKMEKVFDQLTNDELAKVIKQKEVLKPQKNRSQIIKEKQIELEKRIIDLHIGELVDNEHGMEAKEMLDIQMKNFHDEMELAIQQGVKRVVFIHGVGAGRLKMDIRKELERNYKKYEFQDASFAEYGYGATMVILKK